MICIAKKLPTSVEECGMKEEETGNNKWNQSVTTISVSPHVCLATVFRKTLFLCYVYGCFAYMYVWALMCVPPPSEVRRGYWVPLKLEYQTVVTDHLGAKNQTQVLSESSQCA